MKPARLVRFILMKGMLFGMIVSFFASAEVADLPNNQNQLNALKADEAEEKYKKMLELIKQDNAQLHVVDINRQNLRLELEKAIQVKIDENVRALLSRLLEQLGDHYQVTVVSSPKDPYSLEAFFKPVTPPESGDVPGLSLSLIIDPKTFDVDITKISTLTADSTVSDPPFFKPLIIDPDQTTTLHPIDTSDIIKPISPKPLTPEEQEMLKGIFGVAPATSEIKDFWFSDAIPPSSGYSV
ncbi:MAG: hypothetical protein JW774_05805, partial [Candidatus Aureabacteria bacterium]|nr:hypothetical protein [Candidatus Auribacterota bacterium]